MLLQFCFRYRHEHILILLQCGKWTQIANILLMILDDHISIKHSLIRYDDNITAVGHGIQQLTQSIHVLYGSGAVCYLAVDHLESHWNTILIGDIQT